MHLNPLLSPTSGRNPWDIAYSEEEAARCFSPDKPLQRIPAEKADHIPDRSSGGSRTVAGQGEFEFVMSRVKNKEVQPVTPTPVWEPWVPWGPYTHTHADADTDADMDGGQHEKEGEEVGGAAEGKRRALVFSLSTVNRERVERTDESQDRPAHTKGDPDQDDMSAWNLYSLYGERNNICCRASYLARQLFPCLTHRSL